MVVVIPPEAENKKRLEHTDRLNDTEMLFVLN